MKKEREREKEVLDLLIKKKRNEKKRKERNGSPHIYDICVIYSSNLVVQTDFELIELPRPVVGGKCKIAVNYGKEKWKVGERERSTRS